MSLESWLKNWQRKQMYTADVPINIFLQRLELLNINKLKELRIVYRSKKRSIDLIQKIFFWIVSITLVGYISSSVFVIRSAPKLFNQLLTPLVMFLFGYTILILILLYILTKIKNAIYSHLDAINDKIQEKRALIATGGILMQQLYD